MPFASESQRRMMWAKHPDIAQRWANEDKKAGRSEKGLPYHKGDTMKTKTKMSPKARAAMLKIKNSKNMPPKMKRALMARVMASESAKAGGQKMSTGKGSQKQALSQLFSQMNKS